MGPGITHDEPPHGVLSQLAACAAARKQLERDESALVRRARVEGYAWQAIADAMGVTRQAVHKKHGKR